TLDPSFGTNGQLTMFFDDNPFPRSASPEDGVGTLLRDADGMLLAVGRYQSARFRADGGIDATFGVGGYVSGDGPRAALQPDGRFLVAGRGVERREGVCAPSGTRVAGRRPPRKPASTTRPGEHIWDMWLSAESAASRSLGPTTSSDSGWRGSTATIASRSRPCRCP